MSRWRREWEDGASENLPVDVYPCTNGEFIPPAPTAEQHKIMALAERETERWRRRMGMSRRDFVRTSAAMAIGLWAVDAVTGGRFGRYAQGHNSRHDDACDLEWDNRTEPLETLSNLPGEFIFDVQSHHVDPQGLWRANNPGIHAAFAVLWPQSGPRGGFPGTYDDGTPHGFGAGELDPIENLSRFHYLKELYLDSATTMCVLSAVPSAPDLKQPLPIAEAAETVQTVNQLSLPSADRCVMHAFVMPNRGSGGDTNHRQLGAGDGTTPLFFQEELDLMTQRVQTYGPMLRGWKVYCPWGDVPNASGWFMDSENIGLPFLRHIDFLHRTYGGPRVLATHKGFALPGFDQRAAAPDDVGPAARTVLDESLEVKFLVYHSGHDLNAGPQTPYPGDEAVAPGERSVNAFIKTLRLNGLDAPSNGGNSPNVYAELGSVWRDYMDDAESGSHLIGKLVQHVGPKRVIWGTDSLWYGSPHREIVALRSLVMTDAAKELYGMAYGMDSWVEDPSQPAPSPEQTIRNAIFGYNAAEAYGIGNVADIQRTMSCDAVNELRQANVVDAGTSTERAAFASNQMPGARTRREFLTEWRSKPWGP